MEITGVAARHTSAALKNAVSAIAAVSGSGAGADVGMGVPAGVGVKVYVAAGVFSTRPTGVVLVLVQPLIAVIRTTTAIITMRTDEPFMFL